MIEPICQGQKSGRDVLAIIADWAATVAQERPGTPRSLLKANHGLVGGSIVPPKTADDGHRAPPINDIKLQQASGLGVARGPFQDILIEENSPSIAFDQFDKARARRNGGEIHESITKDTDESSGDDEFLRTIFRRGGWSRWLFRSQLLRWPHETERGAQRIPLIWILDSTRRD